MQKYTISRYGNDRRKKNKQTHGLRKFTFKKTILCSTQFQGLLYRLIPECKVQCKNKNYQKSKLRYFFRIFKKRSIGILEKVSNIRRDIIGGKTYLIKKCPIPLNFIVFSTK